MNKQLAKNFLNKELADLAKLRKTKVLPEQSVIVMADLAKVKIKEIIKYVPVRP